MLTLARATPGTLLVVYKTEVVYRPEYKTAHWWVGYDEQPGVEGLISSMFDKCAEILKGKSYSVCLMFCEALPKPPPPQKGISILSTHNTKKSGG